MPIFGDPSSPYDEIVEKVTAETATSENWTLMFDICDRVAAEGPRAYKQCLLSVRKRLNHRDPHVVLLALSLLDCLWNNGGVQLRREVSSKDFVGELQYKCTNSNRVIAERARSLVKKWAENECKKDSSLSLIESLYRELVDQAYSFELEPTSQKKKTVVSNDPNVVSSEQEEADIAKAIALSMQENGKKQQQSTAQNNNSYPSLQNTALSESPNVFHQQSTNNSNSHQQGGQPAKQVKALYDFEAAEDNELSFVAGELITVHDDSDQNWWRGTSGRGASGLFPASFVTTDLADQTANEANLNDGVYKPSEAETVINQPKVQIDENVLLKCIQLLEGCDPALDPSTDPPELPMLEQISKAQAPLIDQKLVQIDKQLNMLADVDLAIREVLTAYDTAVQQVAIPSTVSMPPLSSYAPAASSASVSVSSIPATSQQQQHYQRPPMEASGQWQPSQQQRMN